MTWQSVIETGKGWTEYRVSIEGLDFGFVTNRGMERTTSGVQYIRGLKRDMVLHADIDIRECRLNAQPLRLGIVDYQGKATQAFIRKPSRETRLRIGAALADTTINVTNTSGWSAGDILHIGTEAILIGAVDHNVKRFTGCTRGYLNSTIQAHPIQTSFGAPVSPGIYDVPATLQNRRVNLYAYGRGDNLQGNGTLIWKGISFSDVDLGSDASTYTLSAYPITELFKSVFGGGFGSHGIRGIYHPDVSPWTIRIREKDNAILADDGVFTGNEAIVTARGFHETPYDLLNDLNDQLQASFAASGAWTSVPYFEFTNGKFLLSFTVPPGGPKAVIVDVLDGLRSVTSTERGETRGNVPEESFKDCFVSWYVVTPGHEEEVIPLTSIPTANTYSYPALNEDPYPDALAGFYANLPTRSPGGGTDNPPNRLYLNAESMPALFNSVQIIHDETKYVYPQSGELDSDSSERWIQGTFGEPDQEFPAFASPVIRNDDIAIEFGLHFSTSGSVHKFLTELTSLAPQYANEGVMPLITTDDIDLTDIQAELSRSQATPYVLERNWSFFGEGKPLEDILSEELKLLGFIPALTSEGKFTIKPLRYASITSISGALLSHDRIVTKEQFPIFRAARDKILNHGILWSGYNNREDEYSTETHVRYIESLEFTKTDSVYEIKPVSLPTKQIDRTEIEQILIRPLNMFGHPITEITVDVPITAFDISVGDSVGLTNVQLPNRSTSARGVFDIVCLCVGITWRLGDGKGTLKLITPDRVLRGYTPSLRVTQGNYSGGSDPNKEYLFTVSGNEYAPPGSADSDYFKVGNSIEFVESDSWSRVAASGTVTSVFSVGASYFVGVLFSSSVPLALSASEFTGSRGRFTSLHDLNLSDYQKDFVWVASGSVSGSGWQPELSTFGP